MKHLLFFIFLFVLSISTFCQKVKFVNTAELAEMANRDPESLYWLSFINIFELDTIAGMELIGIYKNNGDTTASRYKELVEDHHTMQSASRSDTVTFGRPRSFYSALDPTVSPHRDYIELNYSYSGISEIDPDKEGELEYYLSSYYGRDCRIIILHNNNEGFIYMYCYYGPLNGNGQLWRISLKNKKMLYAKLVYTISS